MRKIHVECYSGYKADQEPIAVTVDGRRMSVLGHSDRWYDPTGTYFRVRLDDGNGYLIKHDREEDAWWLVKVVRTDA